MLLTLAASSLSGLLAEAGGSGELRLVDLPRFAHDHLGLHGLYLSTELLVGADIRKLERIRDAADKSQCPCLVLVDHTPVPLGELDEDLGSAALDRVVRVIEAAHRLGCNAAAIGITAKDDEDSFEASIDRLKRALGKAERVEMNLLVTSSPGLTAEPDRLTDLIKKVGGFRVGTIPDFQVAARTPDPTHFLRRLTPYAAAVLGASETFKNSKTDPGYTHEGYDIMSFADVVKTVGYSGTLAIDYRGKKDHVQGVERTRDMLQAALGLEETSG